MIRSSSPPKTSTGEDSKPAKIPFDSSVWQMQDTGDFIHTKTGEIRDEDGFLSMAEAPDSEGGLEDWDATQDAGGWDDTGVHTASLGDDGGAGGSHGFDDSAQVRPARSSSAADAGSSDERPSKLAPKKKRK